MNTNPSDRTRTQSRHRLAVVLALSLGVLYTACNGHNGRLVLSGALETDDHDLIAPVTSELLRLNVREGDRVSVGDTVGILDTISAVAALRAAIAAESEAAARLADLEAGSDIEKIRAATVRVESTRATLAQSERDLTRFDSLAAIGLVDTRTLEEATLRRDTDRSARSIAEEELADLRRGARVHAIEAAQAAWERSHADRLARERSYEQAFLIASRVGVVQWLPYQVGEYVPVGRAAATIHDPDDLWAKIYIPEEYLARVAPGDTVSFSVDAHEGQLFFGTVVFISSTSEFTPRNVQTPDERLNLVFVVKIAVTPDQEGLRAGMPADFYLD